VCCVDELDVARLGGASTARVLKARPSALPPSGSMPHSPAGKAARTEAEPVLQGVREAVFTPLRAVPRFLLCAGGRALRRSGIGWEGVDLTLEKEVWLNSGLGS